MVLLSVKSREEQLYMYVHFEKKKTTNKCSLMQRMPAIILIGIPTGLTVRLFLFYFCNLYFNLIKYYNAKCVAMIHVNDWTTRSVTLCNDGSVLFSTSPYFLVIYSENSMAAIQPQAERLQQLENIEKDIINAISSAGSLIFIFQRWKVVVTGVRGTKYENLIKL